MNAAVEKAVIIWSWASATVLMGAAAATVGFLLFKGVGTLDLKLIFGDADPVAALMMRQPVFDGLLPAIAGTFMLVVTSVAMALPVVTCWPASLPSW
ncbi:MAG: hypothetical protein P8X96_24665 [Desulfobacteraceae bacterium]